MNETEDAGSYRVAWVEQDGSIFKSAWSSDQQEETDRYHDLQDDENVKRVVLYEKRELNQWDRSLNTDSSQEDR